MLHGLVRALPLAGLLILPPSPAPAQDAGQALREEAERKLRRDSARILRSARGEQAAFERIRKNNLPWAWGGGSGECDERIGRFCLTYGDGEGDEWKPPPEPDEVVAARERLIAELDSAAARIPGDGWIAGQRVRYLEEAGRTAAAVAAARECRAEGWWCAALAGFTHHRAGQVRRADSAFAVAMLTMPAEERSRWNDLTFLLEGDWLRDYRRTEDADRRRFEDRFWRYADPLYMTPGNDLRAEHYARNVWDQLQDRARSPDGIPWGDDLRQILLRYGLPSGWERVRPRTLLASDASIVTHYPDDDLDFLPPYDLLRGEWNPERTRARTGYELPAYTWLERLDHQVAVFRRGDSALVVAAYALPADSLPEGAEVEAALVLLSPDGEEPPVVARMERAGPSGTLVARVAPRPVVLSLETVAWDAERAARARQGLVLAPLTPGLLAVSDLLLLRSPEPLPDSLAAAARGARGSTRVNSGDRVGVYWEVYGLDARPETVSMTLRLVERGSGWLRRAAERIGLVDEVAPVRLRWQERSTPSPVFARSVAVGIPEVPAGEYALELTVTLPGREPLRVTRELEITTARTPGG